MKKVFETVKDAFLLIQISHARSSLQCIIVIAVQNKQAAVKNKAQRAKQVPVLDQQKTVLARANSRFSDPTLEQQEDHTDTLIRMFSLLMVDPSPLPFINQRCLRTVGRPCWRRTLCVPIVNLPQKTSQKTQEMSKEKKSGNFTRRLDIKKHEKKEGRNLRNL